MPNTTNAASVITLCYQRNKYCVFCSTSPRRKRLLENSPSLEKGRTAAESRVARTLYVRVPKEQEVSFNARKSFVTCRSHNDYRNNPLVASPSGRITSGPPSSQVIVRRGRPCYDPVPSHSFATVSQVRGDGPCSCLLRRAAAPGCIGLSQRHWD
jgi:hypothetical protein